MRYLLWATVLAAISPFMFYGCDRAARAMPIDVWTIFSPKGLFVPEDMFSKQECEQFRKKMLKLDAHALCIPVQVEREIS